MRALLVPAMEAAAERAHQNAQGEVARALLQKEAQVFWKRVPKDDAHLAALRAAIEEERARVGGKDETEIPSLEHEVRIPLGDLEHANYQLAFLMLLEEEVARHDAAQAQGENGSTGSNVISLKEKRAEKKHEAMVYLKNAEEKCLQALAEERNPNKCLSVIAQAVATAWDTVAHSSALQPHLVYEAAKERRAALNEQLASADAPFPKEAKKIAERILFLSSFILYGDKQRN